jgi:hypothetical protein
MRNVVNNSSKGLKRTQNVCLSCMVSLHTAGIAITIHTAAWSKRVLAVPSGSSERPAKHF